MPNWLKNPNGKQAHVHLTEDVRQTVVRPGKNEAEVQYDTLKKTAQLGACVDRALEHQAGQIEVAGVYGQHPKKFKSTGDLIRDVFQGVRRGSSKWYDLTFLAEALVPYAEKHGLSTEGLFRDGNVSKSRTGANYLRPLFEHPEGNGQLKTEVRGVLRDIRDPAVSYKEFRRRYTRQPHSRPKAYDLRLPTGGYVLVAYRNPDQKDRLCRALEDKVKWGKQPPAAAKGLLKTHP